MLKINPDIILRADGDGAVLFTPDSGQIFRLNRSGLFIWQCVALGMTTAKIAEKIRQSGAVANNVETGIADFLAVLAARKFVSGYTGVLPKVPEAMPDLPENRPIYDLTSMLRVFTPGDALVLKSVPFAALRVGDVIAFHPNGGGVPGVVHRIISRTDKTLHTMGDNNAGPDAVPVTALAMPQLVVTKVSRGNERQEIPGGADGRRQFRLNRVRRWLRITAGKIVRPLFLLMFWRIELEKNQNGEYFYKRRLIAETYGNNVIFLSIWSKLRFRIADEPRQRSK